MSIFFTFSKSDSPFPSALPSACTYRTNAPPGSSVHLSQTKDSPLWNEIARSWRYYHLGKTAFSLKKSVFCHTGTAPCHEPLFRHRSPPFLREQVFTFSRINFEDKFDLDKTVSPSGNCDFQPLGAARLLEPVFHLRNSYLLRAQALSFSRINSKPEFHRGKNYLNTFSHRFLTFNLCDFPPDPGKMSQMNTARASKRSGPPMPRLPPGVEYFRKTEMNQRLAFLAPASATADIAKSEHIDLLADWQNNAQQDDIGRRVRMWARHEKRRDDERFARPLEPRNSRVLIRTSKALTREQCDNLYELHENIEDTATFAAALRTPEEPWNPELRAIFGWAAPGCYDSARGAFVSARTVTAGQRASMIRMAGEV
jgi:hypothetical protein